MNNSATSNYPDIEIYIHAAGTADILDWLKEIYQDITLIKTINGGKSQNFLAQNPDDELKIPILIIENARDNFSCIWFQSRNTPWSTDLECARTAAEHFNSEIRCSTGSWCEEPADDWFSITGSHQTLIHWPS
jgi:hypothetical protein